METYKAHRKTRKEMKTDDVYGIIKYSLSNLGFLVPIDGKVAFWAS